MRGILVRIGLDHSSGRSNAALEPEWSCVRLDRGSTLRVVQRRGEATRCGSRACRRRARTSSPMTASKRCRTHRRTPPAIVRPRLPTCGREPRSGGAERSVYGRSGNLRVSHRIKGPAGWGSTSSASGGGRLGRVRKQAPETRSKTFTELRASLPNRDAHGLEGDANVLPELLG
jgi:hypothetical protein